MYFKIILIFKYVKIKRMRTVQKQKYAKINRRENNAGYSIFFILFFSLIKNRIYNLVIVNGGNRL